MDRYKLPDDNPIMAEETLSLPMTEVQNEQLEALWILIKGQGKQVQEILLDRLNSLFRSNSVEQETAQHLYIKESLHRAFEDLRNAKKNREEEQTLDEFLKEL